MAARAEASDHGGLTLGRSRFRSQRRHEVGAQFVAAAAEEQPFEAGESDGGTSAAEGVLGDS